MTVIHRRATYAPYTKGFKRPKRTLRLRKGATLEQNVRNTFSDLFPGHTVILNRLFCGATLGAAVGSVMSFFMPSYNWSIVIISAILGALILYRLLQQKHY